VDAECLGQDGGRDLGGQGEQGGAAAWRGLIPRAWRRWASSRRSYRLCTRRDTAPHPGHEAAGPHVLAWTRTVLPL
jgi:hypothetical protein